MITTKNKFPFSRSVRIFTSSVLAFLVLLLSKNEIFAVTLNVPQSYSSLMTAYDAAKDGDEILVAPGTYSTCLAGKNKKITIKAQYPAVTSAPSQQSVLNSACSHVIQFTTPLTSGTFSPGNHVEFIGFVLNGSDDGFSYENGSGIVKDNIIQGQTDDPVDGDGASEMQVIHNFLGNGKGGGDGIETRLHSISSSRTLNIIFRNNIFYNNPHDGIQLIGIVASATPRKYLIANNLIVANKQAGLGTMGQAVSNQTTSGHPLPELVYVVNNTFAGNGWGGIIGGANMKVYNNIFYSNGPVGIRNVSGSSVIQNNLFFGNTVNYEGSNVQQPVILADPKFANTASPPNFASYQLGAGSPAINAGRDVTAIYQEFGVAPPSYSGAPDLGWMESGSAPGPVPTSNPTPTPVQGKTGDINSDGVVNMVDIGIAVDNYSKIPILQPRADINHDGVVDIVDIGIIIDNYNM